MPDIRLVEGTANSVLKGVDNPVDPNDAVNLASLQDHRQFHSVADAAALNALRPPEADVGDVVFQQSDNTAYKIIAIDSMSNSVEQVFQIPDPDVDVNFDAATSILTVTVLGDSGNATIPAQTDTNTEYSLSFMESDKSFHLTPMGGPGMESDVIVPFTTVSYDPGSNTLTIDGTDYVLPTGGSGGGQQLAPVEQARLIVDTARTTEIMRDARGLTETSTLTYSTGSTIMHQVERDQRGLLEREAYTGSIIAAQAARQTTRQGDALVHMVMRDARGLAMESRWFFGPFASIMISLTQNGLLSGMGAGVSLTDNGFLTIPSGYTLTDNGLLEVM